MKILLISHDASRTGAPLLALWFARWIVENTDLKLTILLLNGGELEADFRHIAETHIYNEPIQQNVGIIKKISKKIKDLFRTKHKTRLLSLFEKEQFDFIYGNTILSSLIFCELYKILPNAKFTLHVHEMYSEAIKFKHVIKELSSHITLISYIAASKMVKSCLENELDINNNIDIIYEYIDTKEKDFNITSKKHTQQYNITGSGSVSVRKGFDLFILIAKKATEKYPEIPFNFQWIGFIPENLKNIIDVDIRNLNLQNKVFFTGQINSPIEKFIQSDIFLLTSREDPFPLVVLEHANLKIPTICFDKATGATEFVQDNAGIIVPYLDIESAADALAKLFYDVSLRLNLGANAKSKIDNYDINVQAPKILKIISSKII